MSASLLVRFSSLALLCGTFTIAGCFEQRGIEVQLSLEGKPATCADLGDPKFRIHIFTADVPNKDRYKDDAIGRCSEGPVFISSDVPDGRYEASLSMFTPDRGALTGRYSVGIVEVAGAQPIPPVNVELATVKVRWVADESDGSLRHRGDDDGVYLELAAVHDPYEVGMWVHGAAVTELVAPLGDYDLWIHYRASEDDWFPTPRWAHVHLDEHGASLGLDDFTPLE